MLFFFFFKLFIFRNFIFLNWGEHPTLTPFLHPPGAPLIPSPSFLPSVLGEVLGGSLWARRASPPGHPHPRVGLISLASPGNSGWRLRAPGSRSHVLSLSFGDFFT